MLAHGAHHVYTTPVRSHGKGSGMSSPSTEEPTSALGRVEHSLALLQEAEPGLKGPHPESWYDRLEGDHDDIRSTLEWLVQHGKAERGVELGAVLWRFWHDRGHLREGQLLLESLLTAPGAEARTSARARALYGAGMIAFRQGNQEAARTFHTESLSIAQARGDQETADQASMGLARVALRRGDYAEVRRRCDQTLSASRERGDRKAMATPLHLLAAAARMEGDYHRARGFYNENLALNRELGSERWVAVELYNLACLDLLEGKLEGAAPLLRESLRMSRDMGNQYSIPYGLMGLGRLAVAEGKWERGARLLGAAEARFEAAGAVIDPDDRPEYERSVAALRAGMEGIALRTAWAEGRTMPVEQAIEYALHVKARP